MKRLENFAAIKINTLYSIQDLALEQTYTGKTIELSADYPMVFVTTEGEGLNIKEVTDEDLSNFVIHSLTEREFLKAAFKDPLLRILFTDFSTFQAFYNNDPIKVLEKLLKLEENFEFPVENLEKISKFSFLDVGLQIQENKIKFGNNVPQDLKDIISKKLPEVNIYYNIPNKFLDAALAIVKKYSNSTVLSTTMRAAILDSSNKELSQVLLQRIKTAKDYNFLTIKSDKTVSYLPKGKMLQCSSEGKWATTGRQIMKPHKFFNKLLKGAGTEYDIKCFVDELLSFSRYKVEVVTGKDIGEAYNTISTRYWSTTSCMEKKPMEWYEIYTENPAFKLGIISDNASGEKVGRFLIVDAVTCDDDEPFRYNDRLYYKNEEILAFYNSYCDNHKMTRKNSNSADTETEFYNIESGKFTQTVKVVLGKSIHNYGGTPYMDSLPRAFENIIANNTNCFDIYTSLWTTDGLPENDYDEIDGRFIERGDAVLIKEGDYAGSKTHYNNTVINSKGFRVYINESILNK